MLDVHILSILKQVTDILLIQIEASATQIIFIYINFFIKKNSRVSCRLNAIFN